MRQDEQNRAPHEAYDKVETERREQNTRAVTLRGIA